MSEEFKPITTQEELNQVIGQRLEQARNAERQKFADYDNIKTSLTSLQKDVAAKDTTIADLQGQLKSSRTDLAKTRIALEKGIPVELCSRLTGETEEEIRKDADTLAAFIGKPKKDPPPKKETETEESKSGSGMKNRAALKSLLNDLNLGGNT